MKNKIIPYASVSEVWKKRQGFFALSLGVLVLSLFVGYLVYAFGPTQPFPSGNVDAPLNVGTSWQIKQGGIALNAGGHQAAGLLVEQGRVGIGTPAPASALQVEGYIQFDTRTGMPPATDCDHATERGRTIVDSAAEALWMCMDIGWVNMRVTMHNLTVDVTGQGTVTSYPPGISCPGDCAERYAEHITVTLTATPAAGWAFGGWGGGACTGTGDCVVSMTAARDVQALFQTLPTAYYLFNSSTVHFGNLGGRAGADAICHNDIDMPAVCNVGWAFISVNSVDEIRDMPTTKNVFTQVPWYYRDGGHAGVRVANNWSGLLDSAIPTVQPIQGGLGDSPPEHWRARGWWTGSNWNGAVYGAWACGGFTCAKSDAHCAGIYGNNAWWGGFSWIIANDLGCNFRFSVLCACY